MPTNDDERDTAEERYNEATMHEGAEDIDNGPWYVGYNEEHCRETMHEFDTREKAEKFLADLGTVRIFSHHDLFPDELPIERVMRSLGFKRVDLGDMGQGMMLQIPPALAEQGGDFRDILAAALLSKILGDTEPETEGTKADRMTTPEPGIVDADT